MLAHYKPEAAAAEEIFVAHNVRSALKLGQARGAAVVALLRQGLPVQGYPPRLVKQAVTGYGHADKTQVQHMIQALLELSGPPSSDAADALAVAVCHAQTLR